MSTLNYQSNQPAVEDEKDVKNYYDPEHVESAAAGEKQVIASDHNQYIHDAAEAVYGQKEQSIKSALKTYRRGVIYSIIFSSAIIMEGYDTLLLGQFYANQSFAKRFGVYNAVAEPPRWEIPAKWQTGLGVSASIGQILGLQITGWASERYGYRPTMMTALVCLTGFLFLQFFAVNLEMLLVGYLLLGFPWGTFQTMTVSYAAEIMPIQIRPFLTSYVNLCWVIGQIIASGVSRGFIDNTTELAYKVPFAIQWIWVVPIFIGIFLAPESPWWLTRKGRFEDAERAINKLVTGVSPDFAKKEVAMMHHTNQLELEASIGSSFKACFQGVNLRRTEIACLVWLIQTISGSPLMGSATYFFVSAGLPATTASTLNLIMFIVGGVGTASSWFLMKPFGRRDLYLWGQAILVCIMLITGILGAATKADNSGAQWGIGALLIIFTFVYDITIGPVCYSLVAEIGSTRLRSKTVVLARNLYNIGGVIVGIVNPYLLNTTSNIFLGPKSGFVWAATGLCGLVWTYFRLPEPKGRSYGELDLLFEQKVPARKFKTTVVNEFEGEGQAAQVGGAIVH